MIVVTLPPQSLFGHCNIGDRAAAATAAADDDGSPDDDGQEWYGCEKRVREWRDSSL